ncbi:MAG: DUF697 domain-containing protein [Magnetococcales bacterium]|nr:DUF697 domain-containing protein [Magnetococcales bacterium]
MNASDPWLPPVELVATHSTASVQQGHPPITPVELPAPVEPREEPSSRSSASPHDAPLTGQRWDSWVQHRWLVWLIFGGVTWLAGTWLEEAVYFVLDQFQRHWVLGAVFSLLILVTLTASVMILFNEAHGFVRLRRFDGLRHQIRQMWDTRSYGQGIPLALRLRHDMSQEEWLQPAWRHYHDMAREHHDDRELLELLSRTVYVQHDQCCYRMIVQHGSTTALASTISPFVWLDSLVFLWQNLRMIRMIAQCYGLKPSWSASLFLAKEVMLGLFMAGTADLLADKVAEAVGGHAASIMLAQVGKGAANGLFTARVGLAAINRCRTLPFHPGGEPSMERLRTELFQTIKKSLEQTGTLPEP